MRLARKEVAGVHADLQFGAHDHHNQGASFVVIVNGQPVPGSSTYEYRINLGRTGYKTLRGFIRGNVNVGIQGHCGCSFMATDVAQESTGMSNAYSGYIYMGAFSRLHGDSRLSYLIFGSGFIFFKDAYIDGDEAVLVFQNFSTSSKNLVCYGTVAVK